jgi:hypothetical protein
MDGLKDYSGNFVPDLSLAGFSREIQLDALSLYRKMFLAIDGFWYLAVKERFGDEAAMACDLWAWEKYIRYELKHVTKLFNITGKDVESLFKSMQLSTWTFFECMFELQNSNRGFFRVKNCPTLASIIKEGQGREKYFCREVEQLMLEMFAGTVNPDIRVNALRIPPHTIGSDICCEWEFVLDGGK